MRPTRTPSEQHAVDALKTVLVNEGHEVVEVPEITDRPDAAFVIDGRTIAIECRIFTPERLLKLHGLKMEEKKIYNIFIPLEPHIWLSKAIAAKEPKVADYKLRTQADSVWLVVHSARGLFSHLTSLFNDGLADLFHIAVFQTPHSFERIYLTGENDLPPVCIYSEKDSIEKKNEFSKKRVIRIPVKMSLFGSVTASAAPNGEGQISLNLGQRAQQEFLLQPLDTRFRIDYMQVGSTTEPALLYAHPVLQQ